MRYSRRRGPPAPITFNVGTTPISGLSVTRSWDDGECLVCYKASVALNAGFGFALAVALDGVTLPETRTETGQWAFDGPAVSPSAAVIVPLTAGMHTLELVGISTLPNAGFIDTNGGTLSILQLPPWDDPGEIA